MFNHVFIVGVQKSSTSTIHSVLMQSNEISTGEIKELRYFDINKNKSYYDCLNLLDNHNKIMLDSTPSLIYYKAYQGDHPK